MTGTVMATTSELLDLAVRSHQRGDLRQAETLYRQVLRVNPHHIKRSTIWVSLLKGQGLLTERQRCVIGRCCCSTRPIAPRIIIWEMS